MTRALLFTKASVRRAIAAAESAGLRVTGIGPDGTVIVDNGETGLAPTGHEDRNGTPSKWEDQTA